MVAPSFLRPYLAYVYPTLAVFLFVSGFFIGHKWADRAHAGAVAKGLAGVVEAASADVKVESSASLAFAQTKSARRVADAARANLLTKELANEVDTSGCRVSDGAFRVLIDSIDSANGTQTEAIRGDGGDAGFSKTGEPEGTGLGQGSTGRSGSLWRLPGGQESFDRVDQPRKMTQ